MPLGARISMRRQNQPALCRRSPSDPRRSAEGTSAVIARTRGRDETKFGYMKTAVRSAPIAASAVKKISTFSSVVWLVGCAATHPPIFPRRKFRNQS